MWHISAVPGRNVHTTSTNPLRQSGLCPRECLPPGTLGSDVSVAGVPTISERAPSTSVAVAGDARTDGGLGWALLQLRAGVTYDVTFADRQPGRTGQSAIRRICCPNGASSCTCATRVRMVLICTDGDTVLAKSAGIGGARCVHLCSPIGWFTALYTLPSLSPLSFHSHISIVQVSRVSRRGCWDAQYAHYRLHCTDQWAVFCCSVRLPS